MLQAGIEAINTMGGLHGRTIAIDAENAESEDAPQRLAALGQRTLAIVAPYAPRLQAELRAVARQQVPVVAPVMGPEAQGLDPLFSTLPTARHVLGALAGYWSRLPEQERGTLTVVLGKVNPEATEEFLRDLLPKAGRYRFVSAQSLLDSESAPGQWLLLETAPGLIQQLGSRLLAASTSIAGVPGATLAEVERIVVAAPLLPPRDDPAMEQMQSRLRELKLEAPPALVTIQAMRGIALMEEALRRSGRELSRERLISALENHWRTSAAWKPRAARCHLAPGSAPAPAAPRCLQWIRHQVG
jgi:ABC-type branched-subunit amino acid transport system substrate-binding protein